MSNLDPDDLVDGCLHAFNLAYCNLVSAVSAALGRKFDACIYDYRDVVPGLKPDPETTEQAREFKTVRRPPRPGRKR